MVWKIQQSNLYQNKPNIYRQQRITKEFKIKKYNSKNDKRIKNLKFQQVTGNQNN